MMKTVAVQTGKTQEFLDITRRLQTAVQESGVQEGVAFVYCPHTTAGLCVNENYDPTVTADILKKLDELIPVYGTYSHAEGNAAAHIKSCLVGVSLQLPVSGGRLVLGTWQGVFFCEFDGPRQRKVHLRILNAGGA
jgi:secondary thiamine-phosphate synthase enzyme